jgi:hypothetical protein
MGEPLSLKDKISQFASGMLKGATTDLVGAPVDIANEVLRPFGLASQTPVGGSKFLREKLTGSKAEGEDKSIYETIGTFINPEVASKAMIVAAARFPERMKKMQDFAQTAPKSVRELPLPELRAHAFDKTGVYLDKDGNYKTVISDVKAYVDMDALSQIRTGTFPAKGTVGDVLVHDELFQVYPEIAKIPLKPVIERGVGGSMYPDNSVMTVNPAHTQTELSMLSTLLHETQHAVQHIEKFAPGGAAKQFLPFDPVSVQVKLDNARKTGDQSQIDAANVYAKKLNAKLDEARNRYLNLPGEQEARFTQETNALTEAELAQDIKALLQRGDTPQTYDTRPIRPLPTKP